MSNYPPPGYGMPGGPGAPGMPPPPFAGGPGVPGPRPAFPPGPPGGPGVMPPMRPPGGSFPPPPVSAGGMPGMPGMPPSPGTPGMMGPPPPRPQGSIPPPGMNGPPAAGFPPSPAGAFPPPVPGGPGMMAARPPAPPPFVAGPGGPPAASNQPVPLMPPGPPGIRPPGAAPLQPPGPTMGMPPPPGPGGFPPPPQPMDGMRQSAPGMPGMPPGPPAPFGKPPGPGPMPGGFVAGPPPPVGVQPGMPPPGMPSPGMPPPGMGMAPGAYDPYNQQRLVEQFESLTMGGPNPGSEGVSLDQLPRPTGEMRDNAFDPPQPYDMFNCSPDNMRMTVNAIPNGNSLKARWPLPFGAIVHPMSDEFHGRTVPVINLGGAGIIRCKRCRTYMNPFMTWTDGGRRFKCNVCAVLNEVPHEYYSGMGNDGRRMDFNERPELCSGTVEYVAPAEYMVRPPMPPVYFFVIDVSAPAITSGMVAVAAAAIKDVLDQLPGDERTLVGFLTFDSTIHFYNLKSNLKQPQMMVVTDIEDPFLPQPDDLLVNLRESREVVGALLDTLPNNFAASTHVSDSAMGPALQAAMLAMQHVGGKLQLFQAAVPNLGPGKVKNRESVTAYGTDKEPALRQPEDAFYKRYASEASRNQITVDVYAFSLSYMDLASLACLPRYTCGDLYHYPGFISQRDGVKLQNEIQHNLTRPTAWEAVMRIRCSKGLRITSFHGHFFNRSTDLLALPTCDPDKAFAVQIGHEEQVVAGSVGYVQCALLYTNSSGERRIRVHTLACPVVTELMDMFKAADGPACAALLAKISVERSLTARLDETRAFVYNKVLAILKEFRLLHASNIRAPNRMVYPEAFRYLPVWALGTTKCTALRGGARDVNSDERIVVGHELMAASVPGLCQAVYPDLYPLHQVENDWGKPVQAGSPLVKLPLTVPLSGAYLEEGGAYLIDNGRVFVLWLGRMLSPQWAKEVFGVDLNSQEAADTARLQAEPERPNSPISSRVTGVLRTLRHGRQLHQQCFVVRQGSPAEVHIAQYFVEDRGPGMQSYPDWMIAMHKGIMAK